MNVKVLSWNIWINSYFDEVKKFLQNSDADIIGLQEVRDDDPERETVRFMESLGYHSVFAPVPKKWGGKIWNDGPALFSKLEIVSIKNIILSKDDPRAVVRANISIGNKIIHVFSTHLTHTHQKDSDTQFKQVSELLKHIPEDRSLLMGDFNAIPSSKTIQLVKNTLVDTDSHNQPTWSVYPEGCAVCKPQTIDTRLDYIFTTRDIKTHSFVVEQSKASDHLPISVVVEL